MKDPECQEKKMLMNSLMDSKFCLKLSSFMSLKLLITGAEGMLGKNIALSSKFKK